MNVNAYSTTTVKLSFKINVSSEMILLITRLVKK